jgi:hypothetical protein
MCLHVRICSTAIKHVRVPHTLLSGDAGNACATAKQRQRHATEMHGAAWGCLSTSANILTCWQVPDTLPLMHKQ